jgi:uncharacterized protein YfkK (UPF0435 family)
MISQETLKAVNKGVLTDEQLEEAITHYEQLENLLEDHGDLYKLVKKDVSNTLTTLINYHSNRNENL